MRPSGLALAAFAVLLAACGGSSTGPSMPASIGGTWSYSANISNTQLQTSCQATGTVTINQSGSQFSGSNTGNSVCTGPGGTSAGPAGGTISGGQVTGNSLTFVDDQGCSYSGAASGSPTNRMSGQVTCPLSVGGTTYQFTGTWTASR